jgi:lactoylglutathione lyase
VRLAKPHLDIGLFTNDIAAQRAFWSGTVGLRLDHELDMGPGWVQHRFDANGSVVKVNHRSAALPDCPPSGYVGLSIARSAQDEDWVGAHPGGDRVELVAHGSNGVVGIGITLATPDPGRLLDFYCTVLGFDQIGAHSIRCGDSVVFLVEGPGGTDMDDFAAPGFRYITFQVFDADHEMAEVADRGGRIVREALNFAGVARYGFVADPDGNWIEISARTSLTGIAVS